MIEFVLDIPLNRSLPGLTELFIKAPKFEMHFNTQEYEFVGWGDPISKDGFQEEFQNNRNPGFIVNNLYGHYYYILLNKISKELFIGNSMFSILPLYYYQNNSKIIFSENALSLGRHLNFKSISRRFILETILFNYPLFNNSYLEDIYLIPSNSYLRISAAEVSIIKHTRIEEHFASSPKLWRGCIIEMRDVFLETVKKYLPDKLYCHALTGGFDGRTLVTAALYNKKVFSCYSFGSSESKDTLIASQLAGKAGIPFKAIELNDAYASESNLGNGREFIKNSSGTATFARAHYLFAVKRLNTDYEHIITGNFGSEIFRAAHNAGTVISQNLYSLFNSNNPDEGIRAIENSFEFRCLNLADDISVWEDLKEDILKIPCYDTRYSGFTKNQRFYAFVFEEIFRKYFGAELVSQFQYIKNRTPFLDMDFLKAIFKTELAGIHSDFFEHNPFKRYKGQVLYAHIIRKAYPSFGKMMTDKGYKPDDLINTFGKINIINGYLKKISRKATSSFDPYGVTRAWVENQTYWLSLPIPEYLFDRGKINDGISRELLFKILSLSYLMHSNQ